MAPAITQERRGMPRIAPAGDGLEQVRLRPGRVARVVDLSATGALIETDWRLLPGVRVELQIGEPALYKVAGRVLRCYVTRLRADQIRYRGALAFDQRLRWVELGTPGNQVPTFTTR